MIPSRKDSRPVIQKAICPQVDPRLKARHNIARGTALGENAPKNSSSPEGAKQNGSLPTGWAMTTLGDICSKPQYGWTTSAVQAGKMRLLRTTDITSGRVEWESVPYCRDEPPQAGKYLLRPGDIVISRAGSVGASHLIDDCQPAVFASYLIRFRPLEGIDKRFVAYFLQSPGYWAEVRGGTIGIAVPNVNASKLEMIPVPLAPLPEQHRIVAEIEKQFTRLEAGVAALQRVQANLKRYRASVLKAACEGRLVPTEAELAKVEAASRRLNSESAKRQDAASTYEPADALLQRILKERRAKVEAASRRYTEPSPPEISNLPKVPEGWTWANVGELAAAEANSITDGPFGSNLKTEHYTATGPRVIRLQNIGEGFFVNEEAHISQEHYQKLQKHHVHAGDIVIAALGERPPRSCIIPESVGPAIVKADCIRFKPHGDLSTEYLNFVLNAEPTRIRMETIVHGVGRPRLNLGEVKSIFLPLPPAAEQHRIVAEVERRLSVVDELEAVVDSNLKRAARLRQAILHRAFTGRLVPQDPNDEPAEKLVERIGAMRKGGEGD